MLISICLCTYKRQHLINTLRSINELELPRDLKVEIIIVDNDENKMAKPIVEKFEKETEKKVIYLNEPEKNISIARNAYLEQASGVYIASIDDDELADKKWLISLINTAENYHADIVFGKVVSLYPENTSPWLIEGGFFKRKEYATGHKITSGGAGCTLIKRVVLKNGKYKFDKSYGLTGGEDAELFNRLYINGANLVYCREAIVYEKIESERLNLNYLIKRAFRIGQTFSSYRFIKFSTLQKTNYIAKELIKLFVFSTMCLLTMPLGKVSWSKYLVKASDCYGKLSFLFTKKALQLYK
ncbi:glycosyltransferase family 2 protein [Endozoicomonas sp. 2B-B]